MEQKVIFPAVSVLLGSWKAWQYGRGGSQPSCRKERMCMAAYKDEERGTWYVSFHYYDWTGKNKRKLKRGFKTRKEALE